MLPEARRLSARAGTFDYTEPDSHTAAATGDLTMPLLDVDRLTTAFPIEGRLVSAVSGVSFSLDAGETLALVGESGCGKSLTALSILRLVDPPGRIVGGAVRLDGRDLLTLDERAMRAVRGREIGLVLQEPMTALNPVYTVGSQIAEALEVHGLARGQAARARAIELLDAVRVPDPQRRVDEYPHQLSGGLRQRALIAAALACQPQAAHRRRADDRPRRHDPGPDPRSAARSEGAIPPRAAAHHPRSRRRRAAGGSRRRDVRRPHRRRGAGADAVPRPEAPLHARPAGVAAGPARHAAAGDRRHRAAARPHPGRLRLRPALPGPLRAVRRSAGAGARRTGGDGGRPAGPLLPPSSRPRDLRAGDAAAV